MNTDNIDRFGHCCLCTKNLLTKRVVDGKVIDMFTPQYDETMFLLDNGSQMQVTICKPCKESADLSNPTIHANIMEAIQKGWKLETALLVADEKHPDFTEEKGKQYLQKMSELTIECHSENMDKYALQQKQIEILNIQVAELPMEEKV